MNLLKNDLTNDELKQLIKDSGCIYSDATIDFLIAKTHVNLVPSFTFNGAVKYTDIKKYIHYFFMICDHPNVLIDNKEVDTSELLTKFKVGDVVYYFDKTLFSFIRGEITSIRNCLMCDNKGRRGVSQVGIKRLEDDVDFVCDFITNDNLFLTVEDALACLSNNTFKLEQKHKQLVEDEMSKFNNVNDNEF